jgi:hypothetical protein
MATPTQSAKVVELPTLPAWNGICAGVGMNAVLHGDADDPRVTWVVERGRRNEIIWPPGYVAQFTPNLVVLNAEGQVAALEGDRVDGACVGGPPDYFLVVLVADD